MNTTNYKSFSARHGYEQPKPIQHESMDNDLRTGLWNALYSYSLSFRVALLPVVSPWIYEHIWTQFLKKSANDYPDPLLKDGKECIKLVEEQIFLLPWNKTFNLIEFVINIIDYDLDHATGRGAFINQCNQVLEEEKSAYKIVDDCVTPITNQQEIQTIESAMATPYEGATSHINKALFLFSRRENPDYRNSIKESISAVESIIKEITAKDSFSAGVDNLERCGIKLHGAHQAALKNLYGFTSDADGIRHALTNSTLLEINQNTARFMLVTCSAFVNYIISEKDS